MGRRASDFGLEPGSKLDSTSPTQMEATTDRSEAPPRPRIKTTARIKTTPTACPDRDLHYIALTCVECIQIAHSLSPSPSPSWTLPVVASRTNSTASRRRTEPSPFIRRPRKQFVALPPRATSKSRRPPRILIGAKRTPAAFGSVSWTASSARASPSAGSDH